MAKSILIPYRGDLVTARLGYKAKKKQALRKFKRDLLKVWDLSSKAYLWNGGTYINDKLRDILGIEKNFMEGSSGLKAFGVELKPAADVNKVLALDNEQKDFLRNKCVSIFNKYGKTIKTSYKGSGYDFATFKDGIETEYDGAEDEELAAILYDRMVMYMINNDSHDTTDNWKDLYTTADFFNGDIRSKLQSYRTTFTSADIIRMVDDRLFTKRTYRTIGGTGFLKGQVVDASGIDMVLFNELLDNGSTDNVDGRYWQWNGSSYSLKIDDVKALDENEFMIFIQTHLGTFDERPKKKWYQKGFWGIVFAVVIVVIAVITQQYELFGLVGVGLGATLVVAGMIISITGALIGNQVMMTAGQIVSLVGGGISLTETFLAQQAAVETYTQQMVTAGVEKTAMQQAINVMVEDLTLDTALGVGKFAMSSYSTLSNLQGETVVDLGEKVTPAEKINEIYVADDMSWDYVQRFMPDFIIANSLRIM
jgi:hypothetical protein